MTAQMPDYLIYQDIKYIIPYGTNGPEFDPEEYGIKPTDLCSACWRGYWCVFAIQNETLKLKELYINSEDDKYPPINGRCVDQIKYDVQEVIKLIKVYQHLQ